MEKSIYKINIESCSVSEICSGMITAAETITSSNFRAGENFAYAEGLRKAAAIIAGNDFPIIKGAVFNFQCNPERMHVAKLSVRISSLEIEIFSVLFDAFTSPGCYGNCGRYVNQQILMPLFDFVQKTKSNESF